MAYTVFDMALLTEQHVAAGGQMRPQGVKKKHRRPAAAFPLKKNRWLPI